VIFVFGQGIGMQGRLAPIPAETERLGKAVIGAATDSIGIWEQDSWSVSTNMPSTMNWTCVAFSSKDRKRSQSRTRTTYSPVNGWISLRAAKSSSS
jgi:hypothetical protein